VWRHEWLGKDEEKGSEKEGRRSIKKRSMGRGGGGDGDCLN